MDTFDVIVVGGGISGLSAAGRLRQEGKRVLLLDKAKRLGGRVASGKIGDQLLEVGVPCHGRDRGGVHELSCKPELAASLGLSAETDEEGNSHPAAAALCTQWSNDFDWRQGFVTNLKRQGSAVVVTTEVSGTAVLGRHVILTCPPAQSAQIVTLSGLSLPDELAEIAHTREILLLVDAHLPSGVEASTSGFLTVHQQTYAKATNRAAFALRADTAWSEAAWEDDAQNTRALLLQEFARMFESARVEHSDTKRWRYANAKHTSPHQFLRVDDAAEIYVAGDGFGDLAQSGVRRAATSGVAVATQLLG